MDKKDKQLTRDPRLHDATTPSVATSLEASAEALEESTFPRRPSDLAPLIEILEEQVSDSGYLDAVSKLATAYLVVGRPQDALSLFERCVKENPDFIEAWANLAFTRLQLDLSDEAGVIFPLILKNRASNADLHNLYGHFLALQGLYRDAIVEFERALTISPQFYLAHNNIALAYEALGQREKVLEHFSKAVSLEPLYKGLGIIKDATIHSDCLSVPLVDALVGSLRGAAYRRDDLARRVLDAAPAEVPFHAQAQDVATWLRMALPIGPARSGLLGSMPPVSRPPTVQRGCGEKWRLGDGILSP